MPIGKLYRTWKEQIRAFRPNQRITQIENFAWMMVGIYQSRSVHLSKIAGKVLGHAKLVSTVRRFERFLDNKAIEVRAWYQPIAKQWIAAQWKQLGEIRLIVDGTKVGFAHQLLEDIVVPRNKLNCSSTSRRSCLKKSLFFWSEIANLARFR